MVNDRWNAGQREPEYATHCNKVNQPDSNLVVIDFDPGTAYLASDTAGTVGVVNLDNEIVTPVATGFGNARGLLFIHKMHSKHQDERGE